MTWNRVVYVDRFFDWPRSGASFHGDDLIFFECQFDQEIDEYTKQYSVSSLDSRFLSLFEERVLLFKRWLDAFNSGKTSQDTHPVLPEDRSRYEELSALLDPMLKTDPENCTLVEAEFRVCNDYPTGYEVCWTPQ